eukprot:CAMPEP_0203747470 /NCGR_PEP_ID=MMETSP0098-20131031/2603_1 /ASSEMBLY_ACC=CAM_ASM_000208 /TAXON_ID=96639 /ORGANISM=" , Strain NY0313808BC1" /LENGTH=340 /DNA_ID=CAMNT_0050635895 /DNA_START=224 /DNA_END=1249 /DNA_ORIENTATION=-
MVYRVVYAREEELTQLESKEIYVLGEQYHLSSYEVLNYCSGQYQDQFTPSKTDLVFASKFNDDPLQSVCNPRNEDEYRWLVHTKVGLPLKSQGKYARVGSRLNPYDKKILSAEMMVHHFSRLPMHLQKVQNASNTILRTFCIDVEMILSQLDLQFTTKGHSTSQSTFELASHNATLSNDDSANPDIETLSKLAKVLHASLGESLPPSHVQIRPSSCPNVTLEEKQNKHIGLAAQLQPKAVHCPSDLVPVFEPGQMSEEPKKKKQRKPLCNVQNTISSERQAPVKVTTSSQTSSPTTTAVPNLKKHTKKQLKELLQGMGLKLTGNKTALIERIKQNTSKLK